MIRGGDERLLSINHHIIKINKKSFVINHTLNLSLIRGGDRKDIYINHTNL